MRKKHAAVEYVFKDAGPENVRNFMTLSTLAYPKNTGNYIYKTYPSYDHMKGYKILLSLSLKTYRAFMSVSITN
jgi:hypothetical protein